MAEFHISKMQVLREIYIRELPLILYRLKMKRRNEQLEKLYDQRLSLVVASATAGMVPNGELITKILEDIQKSIERYEPVKEDQDQKESDESWEEKLERLQGVIVSTQQKKRR